MATLIAVSNVTASMTPVTADSLVSNPPAIEVSVKEAAMTKAITAAAGKYDIDPDLALSIAQCESELRQFDSNGLVLRGKENPADVGVFQINEKYHLEDSQKLGLDIYTTKGNIDYAMRIMKRDGAKPWTYSKPCWGKKVALAK